MNMTKTFLLMLGLTGVLVLLGRLAGGTTGMIMAFGVAVVVNFGSYWFSDKIVLSMYRAKPVDETQAPELYRIVERLTKQANLPMPKIYVIPTDTPNAFATGRNPQHAAVAVTQGLLQRLGPDEIEGVLAHELSHVKNRDILICTIAATLAFAIMMISNIARFGMMFGGVARSDDDEGGGVPALIGMLLAIIVAPIAALLIQMAISRSREYQADASGAYMSGRPLGLAHALVKLERDAAAAPMQANQATAHLFIVNPLSGRQALSLFRTHPATEDRVARLEAIAQSGGLSA